MGAAKLRRQAMGAAYGAAPAWAWHYTLGRKIPLILRDGALRDAWMDCNRERFGLVIPYSIWLTTAESVDPTSTAALTLAQCYCFDRAESSTRRVVTDASATGCPTRQSRPTRRPEPYIHQAALLGTSINISRRWAPIENVGAWPASRCH